MLMQNASKRKYFFHVKIQIMHKISFSVDELIESLLNLPKKFNLCLLDSCGVSHLNSHLLLAGISPLDVVEINDDNPYNSLKILEEKLVIPECAAFLTFSYDFGLKLNKIEPTQPNSMEPDVFLALFDVLLIHDYNTKETYLTGNSSKFGEIESLLKTSRKIAASISGQSRINSNLTKQEYLAAVEKIQEFIRSGNTYQTNLTQQFCVSLPQGMSPENIFRHLKESHPAPFASFIRRPNDTVVSASPERFSVSKMI